MAVAQGLPRHLFLGAGAPIRAVFFGRPRSGQRDLVCGVDNSGAPWMINLLEWGVIGGSDVRLFRKPLPHFCAESSPASHGG